MARGEEEMWTWQSFGSALPEEMVPDVVYGVEHALHQAGILSGGKISMIECAKMAFYVEPIPQPNTTGFTLRNIRFTIQANQFGMNVLKPPAALGGRWNIHKLIDRPEMYWIHEECSTKSDTTVDYAYQYPVVYDVTSPDGQGILFKGTHLWVTAMSHLGCELQSMGQGCFTWYCLCRQVWVTPEYFAESRISAAQSGMGGKTY